VTMARCQPASYSNLPREILKGEKQNMSFVTFLLLQNAGQCIRCATLTSVSTATSQKSYYDSLDSLVISRVYKNSYNDFVTGAAVGCVILLSGLFRDCQKLICWPARFGCTIFYYDAVFSNSNFKKIDATAVVPVILLMPFYRESLDLSNEVEFSL